MVLKAYTSPFNRFFIKLLKTKSLDVYYNKSYIKCYNFYQEYEDHFAIAKVKGLNRISFAAFFLYNYIKFY